MNSSKWFSRSGTYPNCGLIFAQSRTTSRPPTVTVPALGRPLADEDADGGRFAGPVRAEQAEQFAAADVEVQARPRPRTCRTARAARRCESSHRLASREFTAETRSAQRIHQENRIAILSHLSVFLRVLCVSAVNLFSTRCGAVRMALGVEILRVRVVERRSRSCSAPVRAGTARSG